MPQAMKVMRKMLREPFKYETGNETGYSHGTICGAAELSDDDGDDGDRAE